MIWLWAIGLAILTAAALVWSLLRPLPEAPGEDTGRLLYKAQLADLEQAQLDAEEKASLRTEVARRLLAHDRSRAQDPEGRHARGLPRLVIAGLLLIPLAALAIYSQIGAPSITKEAPPAAPGQDIATLVDQLAAKMVEHPDDVQGWRLLARSAGSIGRFDLSLNAYRRAMALDNNQDIAVVGDFAETLVMAEHAVVPEARRAFDAVLAANPQDPRARYYLAEAEAETGGWDKALAQWIDLLKSSPPDADYAAFLRTRIAEAAQVLGRDVSAELAEKAPARGPTREDMANAAQMSATDRQTMIEGMVGRLAERLKTNPDDPAGWRKLGRARLTLGQIDLALTAYDEAVRRDPQSVEAVAGLAQALRQGPGPDDPRYAKALEQLLALDPDNAEALEALGARDLLAGHVEDARAKWSRLLAGWPKGEAGRTELIDRLTRLAKSRGLDPGQVGIVP